MALTFWSTPWASVGSVPSGPLLKSQTGRVTRVARARWTNPFASPSQWNMYAALPMTNAS